MRPENIITHIITASFACCFFILGQPDHADSLPLLENKPLSRATFVIGAAHYGKTDFIAS
jgi:hypothetical protein